MKTLQNLFYLFVIVTVTPSFGQFSDLNIDMMVESKTPNVRSIIKFTITVNNAGPNDATGVAIVNEFGNGFGEIELLTENGELAGNRISWSNIEIPAYDNKFFHFKAKVLSTGEYWDRAEIVFSDIDDPNSDPESGFDTDDYEDGVLDDDEIEMNDISPVPSDFDKDNIYDINDLDDDNDGIPDTYESNNINPDDDFDNDGTPVYLDDNDNNFDIGDNNELAEVFFDYDNDSIPNHLDYDSDGDGIFDIFESGHKLIDGNTKGKIFSAFVNFGVNGMFNHYETSEDSGILISPLLNTDNDDDFNFLDRDDDNDGILTINENADPNGDGSPEDALDSDGDGIPDYLDNDTANPTDDIQKSVLVESDPSEIKTATIAVRNSAVDIKLFTKNGIEVTPEITKVGNLVQVDISNLESGTYFLQFRTGNKIDIKRMVID